MVAALASDVELYLFDEPTSGFDPLMEAVFQDHVHELREAGRTVLLSSHVLAQVEALCDRVTIIRRGRTVESGTLAELRHLTRTSMTVETARPVTGLAELPACTTWSRPTTAPGLASTSTPPAIDAVLAHLVGVRGASPFAAAADPGGAVPAPLRRRAGPRAGAGRPGLDERRSPAPPGSLRLALRRDRSSCRSGSSPWSAALAAASRACVELYPTERGAGGPRRRLGQQPGGVDDQRAGVGTSLGATVAAQALLPSPSRPR